MIALSTKISAGLRLGHKQQNKRLQQSAANTWQYFSTERRLHWAWELTNKTSSDALKKHKSFLDNSSNYKSMKVHELLLVQCISTNQTSEGEEQRYSTYLTLPGEIIISKLGERSFFFLLLSLIIRTVHVE